MRDERTEGRSREVENEPAVRGVAAQGEEGNREGTERGAENESVTRRGSSSERSER